MSAIIFIRDNVSQAVLQKVTESPGWGDRGSVGEGAWLPDLVLTPCTCSWCEGHIQIFYPLVSRDSLGTDSISGEGRGSWCPVPPMAAKFIVWTFANLGLVVPDSELSRVLLTGPVLLNTFLLFFFWVSDSHSGRHLSLKTKIKHLYLQKNSPDW